MLAVPLPLPAAPPCRPRTRACWPPSRSVTKTPRKCCSRWAADCAAVVRKLWRRWRLQQPQALGRRQAAGACFYPRVPGCARRRRPQRGAACCSVSPDPGGGARPPGRWHPGSTSTPAVVGFSPLPTPFNCLLHCLPPAGHCGVARAAAAGRRPCRGGGGGKAWAAGGGGGAAAGHGAGGARAGGWSGACGGELKAPAEAGLGWGGARPPPLLCTRQACALCLSFTHARMTPTPRSLSAGPAARLGQGSG